MMISKDYPREKHNVVKCKGRKETSLNGVT